MITASHNPECDNGVKLVDPKGRNIIYLEYIVFVCWCKRVILLKVLKDNVPLTLLNIFHKREYLKGTYRSSFTTIFK